jgi:hypothetical protein
MEKLTTITLCASISAFSDLIRVKNELETLGITVLAPELALEMEKKKDFSFPQETMEEKIGATLSHFQKIEKSDATLIVNAPKYEYLGYIGPAVLMEMTVTFFLGKPIYLLYQPDDSLPNLNEIQIMQPHILNGKLSLLTLKNKPQSTPT